MARLRNIANIQGGVTNALVPTGCVFPYAGSTPPSGYLFCDGSEISRVDFPELFSVIHTIHGAGDGVTTFNLPDLRQRFPIGKAASGTASVLGTSGGQIDHSHIGGSHSHDLSNHTHTAAAHTHDMGNHTHTAAAHTHDLSNHTHTGGAHTHDLSNHTHTGGSHTHGLASHVHTLPDHSHGMFHTHGAGTLRAGWGNNFGNASVIKSMLDGSITFSSNITTIINAPNNMFPRTDDGQQCASTIVFGSTDGPSSGSTAGSGQINVSGPSTNTSDAGGVVATSGPNVNNTGSAGSVLTSGPSVNSTGSAGGLATTGPSTNSTGSAGGLATTGPSVNNTGSGGAVSTSSNNPPFYVLNFIIKT